MLALPNDKGMEKGSFYSFVQDYIEARVASRSVRTAGPKDLTVTVDGQKQLMILSPGPPLGEKTASLPSNGEAVLLHAVVTPPEPIYSKFSGLSSAGLL